jgi:phenylalanyl-tRNA synthetase alpha subunit
MGKQTDTSNDISSLNITLRKKQMQQVNHENIKIYKRLNEVKPVISTEKLVKSSNLHLLDIGARIKRYRNQKMDPLVSIAKRREREFLTGGVNSQASLNASPTFDVDPIENYNME